MAHTPEQIDEITAALERFVEGFDDRLSDKTFLAPLDQWDVTISIHRRRLKNFGSLPAFPPRQHGA